VNGVSPKMVCNLGETGVKLGERNFMKKIKKDKAIVFKKVFEHRTFEERLAEYNGKISVYDFDWGEPVGRESLFMEND